MRSFTAIAPAKVNLQLRVDVNEPNETFHKVQTVMQTLSLHDKLQFLIPDNEEDMKAVTNARNRKINDAFGLKEANATTLKDAGLTISVLIDDHTSQNIQIAIEDNLVTKAILKSLNSTNRMLEDAFPMKHIEAFIEKNIPAQAGLGGGSSDAVATLQVMSEIININNRQKASIAANLGSDVPFFLYGGRAEMFGTGVNFSKKLDSLKNPIVLIKPKNGVDTKSCYEAFDKHPKTMHPKGSLGLVNDLQESACKINPEIIDVLDLLKEHCEEDDILMSGSGSACFAICDTFSHAQAIATVASKRNWWSRACSFVDVKACLLKP